MTVDAEILVEILNKLDDFIDELVAQQKFQNWTEMEGFLNAQYESRLDSILKGKSSSIDALDYGMKDKITARKKRLFDHLEQAFQKGEI